MHSALTPDVVTSNTAPDVYEKGMHWGVTIGLLDEMVHQKLTPQLVSMSTAMSACEKGYQWQGSLG